MYFTAIYVGAGVCIQNLHISKSVDSSTFKKLQARSFNIKGGGGWTSRVFFVGGKSAVLNIILMKETQNDKNLPIKEKGEIFTGTGNPPLWQCYSSTFSELWLPFFFFFARELYDFLCHFQKQYLYVKKLLKNKKNKNS